MTHPDTDLARENAALRARLDAARHTGDMARAQTTDLRRALECLLAGPTDAAQTRARAALADDHPGAALEAETARLRADAFALRTALEQQQRALEAERAARQIVEADNAALIRLARAAVECVRGLCYDDGTDAAIKRADRWMPGFMQHLVAPHPGTALLAELDAARAVGAAADTYLVRESKYLPVESENLDVIGDLIDAVAAYRDATKARAE
jgi:hypothetical protein